jgi:hypothetical protein
MAYRDPRVDEVIARELAIYVANSGDLYRQMTRPTILALSRRRVNKTYDAKLAVKAWENIAEEAIKRYTKEYGKIVANPATRNAAAKEMMEDWDGEIRDTTAEMLKLKKAGKAWSMSQR